MSATPKCPHGCGPTVVPILAMNRGAEQKSWNPTHTVGCCACGETWTADAATTARVERAERRIDASAERQWREREKADKAKALREKYDAHMRRQKGGA